MPGALAIAPYFGRNYTPSDIPPAVPAYPAIDDILTVICPAEINNVKAHVIAQKQAADEQGCRLICYEGGQHFSGIFGAENDDTLTGILNGANRDQRMYNRYMEYQNMLRASGVDMFGNFSFVGAFSKWGSWGVLEYMNQPIDSAPKYRALLNWINAADRGDFNSDGYINLADIGLFTDQWLTSGPEADLNESTSVDFIDFALIGPNWQQ
jgi:hypothetical protein